MSLRDKLRIRETGEKVKGFLRKKSVRRIAVRVLAAVALAYSAVVAPVIPYFISDVKTKMHTEQNNPGQYLKSTWGAFVWYPKNRVKDWFAGLKPKDFVVNKATQQLFVYDRDGNLELTTSTSTGKHKGIKKRYAQKVTPHGEYIAVRRLDEEGIWNWYAESKGKPLMAEQHGVGEFNFLGQWFPEIAVHGTKATWEQYLGGEKSLGCPRVDKDTIEYLVETASVGTRLVVHEYAIMPVVVGADFNFEVYLDAESVLDLHDRKDALDYFGVNNPFVNDPDDLVPGQTVFLKDYDKSGTIDLVVNNVP